MNRPSVILGIFLAVSALVLSACDTHDRQGSDPDHAGDDGIHTRHDDRDAHADGDDHHGHGDSDEPSVAITHFTDFAELFVEFPAMSVGNESPFAAHFTWLDNFRPVAEGKVRIHLRGGGLPEEEFSIGEASIPGVFRPVAVPAHAGQREVIVVLESAGQTSVHDLGAHTVYTSKAVIPAAMEEDEGHAISYLKEQQWQVDFATTLVSQRTLRESIRAVATIKAAADGEAEISTPHDGQLARRGNSFPSIGTHVRKGQVLAVVGSPLGRELKTSDKGVSGTALRAPIDGVIAHVHATAGSYLKKGQSVFHIVDPARLWLESRIPESDVLRLTDADGAWVSLPSVDGPFVIITKGENANGRVVAFSQAIDPRTRTAALILEFINPDKKLRIGMLLEAHVLTGRSVDSVAVPLSAIVRDNGVQVVYVESGGESFERRVVQLGIRDGDFIEVRSGVTGGERVVSRGAYLVKLAASGPAEAGHGHAH
ncbi:MAG: efflux RND transporter periplasmic adaptor subunit [Thiogranum sp.]